MRNEILKPRFDINLGLCNTNNRMEYVWLEKFLRSRTESYLGFGR